MTLVRSGFAMKGLGCMAYMSIVRSCGRPWRLVRVEEEQLLGDRPVHVDELEVEHLNGFKRLFKKTITWRSCGDFANKWYPLPSIKYPKCALVLVDITFLSNCTLTRCRKQYENCSHVQEKLSGGLSCDRAVDGDPRLLVVDLPSLFRRCAQLFNRRAMLPVAVNILSTLFAVTALGHGRGRRYPK
ncbi:hypothetical protein CRG98_031333 [Punica granatum]|uniref:Uncharacterized protein n=1 Tax=Punica granatum TaxID=22663 RepID=A0A2I0IWC5_PUNGR|nr:hypothetical protein CRG98_031333 [Punica granatum]